MYLWLQAKRLGVISLGPLILLAGSLTFATVGKDATAPSVRAGMGARYGQSGSSTTNQLRYLRSTHAGGLKTVAFVDRADATWGGSFSGGGVAGRPFA